MPSRCRRGGSKEKWPMKGLKVLVSTAAATLVLVLCAGCVSCDYPRVSREEAIVLATKAAERRGYQLANYEAPTVSMRKRSDDCVWVVKFVGKERLLLDHWFWVSGLSGAVKVEA